MHIRHFHCLFLIRTIKVFLILNIGAQSYLQYIFEHKKWTKTLDIQPILVSAGRGKKKKKSIHSCKMLCKLQGMIVNVSSKAKTF